MCRNDQQGARCRRNTTMHEDNVLVSFPDDGQEFLLPEADSPPVKGVCQVAKASCMTRSSMSLRFLLATSVTFIVSDLCKVMSSYALRYYNHDRYPVDQTILVALTEGSKGVVCFAVHRWLSESWDMRLSVKFLVPSVIYAFTNNIFFYALNYVTPAVWIILVQSKVLLTLLAYKFYFRKDITCAQWTAGLLIIIAVSGSQLDDILRGNIKGQLTAILLGLLNSLLSTIASVYTEFLFKNDTRTMWEQQVQIYSGGAVFAALAGVAVQKTTTGSSVETMSSLTASLLAAIIVTATIHGIMTAVVVKSLDNIVKYQLSATCNVLNCIICASLFPDRFHFTSFYVLSFLILLLAIYLYERQKFELPKMCQGAL
ncbi:uncharacterized protein LOC135396411 isoform X2 [Ornithodoros turicata]|uniref:uncharacterized protein LOC135396411 isoform X2 n=2 Tax=Ornithodoros turicata TaxID=34597 RepID=UPI0031395A60